MLTFELIEFQNALQHTRSEIVKALRADAPYAEILALLRAEAVAAENFCRAAVKEGYKQENPTCLTDALNRYLEMQQ